MGLEDRDWYREEPSPAWKDVFRTSGSSTGGGGWNRPPRPPETTGASAGGPPSRRLRADAWFRRYLFAPLSIAAAAWLLYEHGDRVAGALGSVVSAADQQKAAPAAPTPLSAAAQSKVVRLASRPGLDEPARTVARWSLADPRFGEISVYVPVGTTPREALTVALAERGYQVLPAP